MTLLLPLGLLGLLGVVALIIIYIIKPNYQQKFVSSTFVWRLSLKKKKKKLPVSKLRNILLIACQILFLTSLALVLTQPSKVLKERIDSPEVVAVVDVSASMNASMDFETRKDRAVEQIRQQATDVFARNGYVSVILAADKSDYVAKRVDSANQDVLWDALDDIVAEEFFGTADVEEAIRLSEEVFAVNPDAKLYLYTDVVYDYVPKEINVVNVNEDGEWNVAILNAYSKMEGNFFNFYVEVGCYGGRNVSTTLKLSIDGAKVADGSERLVEFECPINCTADSVLTVTFRHEGTDVEDDDKFVYYNIMPTERIYAYRSVYAYIEMPGDNDCIAGDDDFFIYGGEQDSLGVVYSSSQGNSFVFTAMQVLKNMYGDKWNVNFEEKRVSETAQATEIATQTYDFYIFEHMMPQDLPQSGVVLLMDPDLAPRGVGFRVSTSPYEFVRNGVLTPMPFAADEPHALMADIVADNISVSRFTRLMDIDASYTTLMSVSGYPTLIVSEGDVDVIVLPFSVHYSNLAIVKEFPLLLANIFDYFFSTSLEKYGYEVGENISLDSVGNEVHIEGRDYNNTISKFPTTLTFSVPGSYTVSQTTLSGREVMQQIYVSMPSAESNVAATASTVSVPYSEKADTDYYQDLLLYLGIALAVLIAAEWILYMSDNK